MDKIKKRKRIISKKVTKLVREYSSTTHKNLLDNLMELRIVFVVSPDCKNYTSDYCNLYYKMKPFVKDKAKLMKEFLLAIN